MREYKTILFVIELKGFQPRSILIPKKEFLKNRKEDYEILKKYSVSTKVDNYDVKNVLIVDYQSNHPITRIISDIFWYADSDEPNRGSYIKEGDLEWFNGFDVGLMDEFDHVKNYHDLVKMFKPTISFLVFES